MPVLTKIPKIEQLSDIPPIEPGKGAGPEDRLWREIIAIVNGIPLSNPTWPQRAGNLEALGGQGSDNHGQMASAAWYLAAPEKRIAGRTAAEFWRRFTAAQLGELEEDLGDSGLFQLSEPTSNDYDGYTVGGSWCTVWDRALKIGDTETAAAMEKLVTTWAAMVTLMSTWPTVNSFVVHREKKEVTTHKNPSRTLSRCSAGSRSTSSHLHADPASLILTDLIRFPGKHPHPKNDPFDFWYLQITARRAEWLPESIAADMRAVIADHDLAAADRVAALIPESARWKGDLGIEIRRWEDGTVVGITAECLNGNTGWLPASIVVPGQPAEHCWPWKEAKPKNPGSGGVTEQEGQVFVHALDEGKPVEVSPISLPATPPARVYRFCSRGFEVNGQRRESPEKPEEPEKPEKIPEAPGALDLDTIAGIAGIVEGLSLAKRDRELQAQLVSELRSASHRPLPEIAADLERFGIGDAQEQAGPWRAAIRRLREAAMTPVGEVA